MSRPDLATTPLRPAPDIVHRRIAGEQILVPVRRGAWLGCGRVPQASGGRVRAHGG